MIGNYKKNPFLEIEKPRPLGPGSYEMAMPLVNAVKIEPGMRVLEVGAGTGQVASILAKHWNVSVVTLEIWEDLNAIHNYAYEQGVSNQVLALKAKAQNLPFANEIFDAVISIGSFEMIKDERPQALKEIVRVAKKGAYIGIAEPMGLSDTLPEDLQQIDYFNNIKEYFRTVEWNCELFRMNDLIVTDCYYFNEGYKWWVDNFKFYDGNKEEILLDGGRWLSLGLVAGKK